MNRPPSTSELRPRQGLDRGARQALVRALADAGAPHGSIVSRVLRTETYADIPDYLAAVDETWGGQVLAELQSELEALVDQNVDQSALDFEGERAYAFREYGTLGLLLAMPEGDFLTALEVGATLATDVNEVADLPKHLTRICERRGVPYAVGGGGGEIAFLWHGDATVAEEAIEPALGALDDARLADGPGREFRLARRELRAGTPDTLKQAVAESCNAVESTMKVVLDENGIARPRKENARDLFSALVAAGLAAEETEEILLAASRFGNRKGRHGAGPVAHNVRPGEAQAVLAAAATAIALLAVQLA